MRWFHRWVLFGMVGLFGFLSGVVWMKPPREAQRKPRVQESVVAREFKLVDRDGNVRAELSIPFGDPVLFLYDRTGKPRAWLTLDREGNPRMMFVDKNDMPIWQAPAAEAKPSQ
ncbi:hypothetical protein HRbin15_01359 [bacterium HR15]|nr:hypothetical protein HRbin15_01359 [bacterium HR15]